MSIKAKIEAIVYAAEEPVTIDQVVAVLADEIAAEQHAESSPPLEATAHDASDVNDGRQLADAKHEAKQQRDLGRKRVREILEQLTAEYDAPAHGMEIRQVAGGYRMSTKPEHHDVVRSFARS